MSGKEEPQGLEAYASEQDEARFAENAELKRKLNAARANYSQAESERRRLEDEVAVLRGIYDDALVLQPEPGWLQPDDGKASEHRATLVAMLSDLHAGERVRASEMGGFNQFDTDICGQRLERYFSNVVKLARRGYLGPQTWDGIVLAIIGDLVSGDIHPELVQTNDMSTYDSALWLAPRLLAGIEAWAEEFGKVHVVSAPGNHGRNSSKPIYKTRSANNADTLIAKMVAMFYGAGNSTGAVTFDIPDGFDAIFSVYDKVFSMEHGEELQRSNPGTSEIGSLGPAKRGQMRKARQMQAEGKPFDYLLLGHFHQLVFGQDQGFVMNGSLKGFDEFARGLHLKPERPQQGLLVVTPEHGIVSSVPVLVADRANEGW